MGGSPARQCVLLVGVPCDRGERLRRWMRALPGIDLEAATVERLPADVSRYRAILIDAGRPSHELHRLASSPDMARRSRVLLDPTSIDGVHAVTLIRDSPLLAILDGPVAQEHEMERALSDLLLFDPVVTSLQTVLKGILQPSQKDLVVAFLRLAAARTPRKVAAAMSRSLRSLLRDCRAAGLPPPQHLHRFARVCTGLTHMSLHGTSVSRAAMIAGYRDASSFRRAVKRTFADAAVPLLVREWSQAELLAKRVRGALTA